MDKIKFRDLKGIYTDIDSADVQKEFLYDSSNIRYEKGYCETEYPSATDILSVSGTIEDICFGYIGTDTVRVKGAMQELRKLTVLVERSTGSYYTWQVKYSYDGMNFTSMPSITDATYSNGKARIVNSDGIFKIFFPFGIYRLGEIKGVLSLTDVTGGYNLDNLPELKATTDESVSGAVYCRRVPIGIINKDNQWRFVSVFLRCDSQGRLIRGTDSIYDFISYIRNSVELTDYDSGSCLGKSVYPVTQAWYKASQNLPVTSDPENGKYYYGDLSTIMTLEMSMKKNMLANNLLSPSAGSAGLIEYTADTVTGFNLGNTTTASAACIKGFTMASIVWFGSKCLFIDKDDGHNFILDDNGTVPYEFKGLPYGTLFSYSQTRNSLFNNMTMSGLTITGNYHCYPMAFVILEESQVGTRSLANGFTKQMDYAITGTIDEKDEIVLKKGTIGQGGKAYQISVLPKEGEVHPLLTRYKVYVKPRIFSGDSYTEDKMTDYELCNTQYLLPEAREASENVKSIIDTDRQGIYLTQALGTFYDENYRVAKKIDGYAVAGDMPFVLSGNKVIPGTIGGGSIFSWTFYRSNALDLPSGERIVKIEETGGMLGVFTEKRLYLILRQNAGGVQIYKIKDTVDFAIKDEYAVCRKGGSVIALTNQGIVLTNGYEQKPLSDAVNRDVKEKGGRVFFNSYRQELYWAPLNGQVYRYKFSNGYWDILSHAGQRTMFRIEEGHDGEIFQIFTNKISSLQYTGYSQRSYLQFSETDLGDVPSLKVPLYINIDMSIESDVTENTSVLIGLNRSLTDTGKIFFTYLSVPVKKYDNALKKWVNNFKGRKTLRVAVPLQKWYKNDNGVLAETNVEGSFVFPYRQPVNRLYLSLTLNEVNAKIYNIELEYDILRTMNVSLEERIGYGKHYGKCYGKFL